MSLPAKADEHLPEGTDLSQPYLDPIEEVPEVLTNLLVVDGQTGSLRETVDRGGNGRWTVKVVDLSPRLLGLGLKSPTQATLSSGAGSTAAGSVEFFEIKLTAGVYTVFRNTELGDAVVIAFSTADIPSALMASSTNSNDPSWETGSYPDCLWGVIWEKRIYKKVLWTPLLVANSPYYGSTEATTSFTNAKATFILAYGTYSRLDTGPGLSVSNGETRGVFRLVEWSQYEQRVQQGNCQQYSRYTYRITDQEPTGSEWTESFDLSGSLLLTAADDLTSVEAYGYDSVKFDFRYRRPANRNIDTGGGGYSWTTGQGGGDLWNAGFDVGFQHPNTPASVSFGTFRGERDEGVTSSYRYDFPEGWRWNATYYGGSNGTWSFCFRSYLRC